MIKHKMPRYIQRIIHSPKNTNSEITKLQVAPKIPQISNVHQCISTPVQIALQQMPQLHNVHSQFLRYHQTDTITAEVDDCVFF